MREHTQVGGTCGQVGLREVGKGSSDETHWQLDRGKRPCAEHNCGDGDRDGRRGLFMIKPLNWRQAQI